MTLLWLLVALALIPLASLGLTTVMGRAAGWPLGAACLVAGAEKAKSVLGWKPRYPDLRTIVQHAWNWHRAHPRGYGK